MKQKKISARQILIQTENGKNSFIKPHSVVEPPPTRRTLEKTLAMQGFFRRGRDGVRT